MANIKKGRKKTNNNIDELRRNAGICILLVACICFVLLILFCFSWSNDYNFGIGQKIKKIFDSETQIASVEEKINSTDEKKLFDATYYDALDNLSDLAYNTKWIDTCPNSQTRIGDELYVKVCDSRFTIKNDILYYYENIFSKDFTLKLIDKYYTDYNGELYLKPFVTEKNENYVKIDSYTVKFKTNDKISYVVKSMYKTNESDFEYVDGVFEIVKNENVWVVSKIDLPF